MPPTQEISARPLDPRLLQLQGISRASVEAHHRLYQGYVAKRNEILGHLATVDLGSANGVPSSAALRFVTYAAWCLSWWISIVRASMCGSSASNA